MLECNNIYIKNISLFFFIKNKISKDIVIYDKRLFIMA